MVRKVAFCLLACLLWVVYAHGLPDLLTIAEAAAMRCNARGMKYLDHGKPALGILQLKKATDYNPNRADYHTDLALAMDAFPDAACEVFGCETAELFAMLRSARLRARKLECLDVELAVAYAQLLGRASEFGVEPDWDEALAAWKHCLVLLGNEPPSEMRFPRRGLRASVLLDIGRIERVRDRHEIAIQYFEEALELLPDSVATRNLLRETAQECSRHDAILSAGEAS